MRFVSNLFRAVRPWCQFDERVKWHIHPGALGLVLLHKVCVDAAQNRLVSHNENVLATFQFHYDWFQADDHVTVRLATTVSVVVFILITGRKVFGVAVFDFLVGQAIAHTGIQFIQRFPLQLVVVLREEAGCGNGTFQR